MPKHPAAFINNIADEGTKSEAIEWLAKTWDDFCDAQEALRRIKLAATCESLSLTGYANVLAEIRQHCFLAGVQ